MFSNQLSLVGLTQKWASLFVGLYCCSRKVAVVSLVITKLKVRNYSEDI